MYTSCFICSFCGHEYAKKSDCKECEAFHVHPWKLAMSSPAGGWDPVTKKGACKYPRYVSVKMTDGKEIRYRME